VALALDPVLPVLLRPDGAVRIRLGPPPRSTGFVLSIRVHGTFATLVGMELRSRKMA